MSIPLSKRMHAGDALAAYAGWAGYGTPAVIISDGAYGVGGFPGDPKNPRGLGTWYEPHVKQWSEHSDSSTALWFWNTELGWANTHPVLEAHGWKYVQTCVWDKGIGHIAGNVNSKTIHRFPVVTEICVLYQREPQFIKASGEESLQDWMRKEWKRTGLPFSKANEACGVKNAASRKYFAADHLFYPPPADAMEKIVSYAKEHGKPLPAGEPEYFAGFDATNSKAWESIRYKWNHTHGLTNVWQEPALRSSERLKFNGKSLHLNQKPLSLSKRIIEATTDAGDIVWDVFGGSGSISVAAKETGRIPFYAEHNPEYYALALQRLND